MRVNFLILVTLVLFSHFGCNDLGKVKMFSKALDGIIKEFYIKNSLKFDIVAADVTNWKFASDVIQNTVKMFGCEPVAISYIDGTTLDQINLTKSSIIFFGTSKSLCLHADNMIMHHIGYTKVRHFIVVEKIDIFVDMKLKISSAIILANMLFWNEKLKAILLLQMTTVCGSDKVMSYDFEPINTFTMNYMSWAKNVYEIDEPMRNLKGCNYTVLCSTCMLVNDIWDVHQNLGQFFMSTLRILEEKLNFQATIYGDGDYNASVNMIFDGGTLFSADKLDIFVFETTECTLIFSTGEPYTPFEKLVIPFDMETWIALGVTFMAGFLTILLLKTCDIERQRFTFGTYVDTPAFNMVVAFFGQGQNILPGRNFARYLLMMFVLFCLVIRTGYQGVQFELIYQVRCLR